MWTLLTFTMWDSLHSGGPRRLISNISLNMILFGWWGKLLYFGQFYSPLWHKYGEVFAQHSYFSAHKWCAGISLVLQQLQSTSNNTKRCLIRISSNSIDTHIRSFWLGQQIVRTNILRSYRLIILRIAYAKLTSNSSTIQGHCEVQITSVFLIRICLVIASINAFCPTKGAPSSLLAWSCTAFR